VGQHPLSDIVAAYEPQKDDERCEREFKILKEIYKRYLDADQSEREEILEELMEMRAEHLVAYALEGFEQGIRNKLILSEEKERVIQAAIDNLVDFAVAEEYQMTVAVEESLLDDEEDDEEYESPETNEYDVDDDDWESIFACFNRRYASTENLDVLYAMYVAGSFIAIPERATLMYMTMGDERVRPWHLQWEGFTATRASFPEWLIPPIEHGCRCYLIEDSPKAEIGDVQAAVAQIPEMPDWFNRTFKESVAKGGRIFSDEHSYFEVMQEHKVKLTEIANRIKSKIKSKQ
jgi:hypothetical protein